MYVLGKKSECRAVSHDLWDFVGERLPENALERVERHLAVCTACATEIEGMRCAQNLLNDCRKQVPAPRSDWHDLQNRMRAEGMISPLSGRVLTSQTREQERPTRRSSLALDWNRLSLVGSITATLILSVTVYRLVSPPTPDLGGREAAVSSLSVGHNAENSRETETAPINNPFAIGNPLNPLLMQVNSVTDSQQTPHRHSEAPARPLRNQVREDIVSHDTENSPIVWSNKPLHESPAPTQKYMARYAPASAEKLGIATPRESSPLVLPTEGKDAKTRYIMRRLTPASFSEEEGIY